MAPCKKASSCGAKNDPAKQKKAKDLDITKGKGGEKVKGGASRLKIESPLLTGKHYR